MQLTLYKNFSKRKNSTKQPTGGTVYNVGFKSGCSLENPVFLIDGIELDYNYAYMNGHYYFIDDIVVNNESIYELHCSQDVLATYKSDIGSYTAFVERSASEYDDTIIDSEVSQKQDIKSSSYTSATFSQWSTTGTYILRVIGVDDGINSYAVSASEIGEALGFMFSEGSYPEDFFTQKLIKSFFNPFQYIVSLMWFPIDISSIVTSSTSAISFGWWTTSSKTYKILDNDRMYVQDGITFGSGTTATQVMPTNPYTDFRKYASTWSLYNIYCPGVGSFPLDAIYADGFTLHYCIDLMTGRITVKLTDTNGASITQQAGQLGVPIQIGQTSVDVGSIVSSSVSLAGNIASENIAGTITSGTGLASALLVPTPSVLGSPGNRAVLKRFPSVRVNLTAYETCDLKTATAGRPLFANKQLSTLSGYVRCSGASVPIDGLGGDKETVNSYLNSGFYYE